MPQVVAPSHRPAQSLCQQPQEDQVQRCQMARVMDREIEREREINTEKGIGEIEIDWEYYTFPRVLHETCCKESGVGTKDLFKLLLLTSRLEQLIRLVQGVRS